MAIDYDALFDRIKLFAGAASFNNTFKAQLDVIMLNGSSVLFREVEDNDNLADLVRLTLRFKDNVDGFTSDYAGLHSEYLLTEGRDEAQSGGQTDTAVVDDIISAMIRDSQSVTQNIIASTTVFDRAGDGTITTFTQNQLARNDTLTLTCTTAQNGGDAIFSLRSKLDGVIAGVTLTADGVSSVDDTDFPNPLGIAALVIGAGSVSNEWALSDQIIITTTSDDRSILLTFYRDQFRKELPNSGSPTIDNNFIENLEAFPSSPLDGQQVVIDGVRYYFDAETTEWVESCI